jgi:hypothetical protein
MSSKQLDPEINFLRKESMIMRDLKKIGVAGALAASLVFAPTIASSTAFAAPIVVGNSNSGVTHSKNIVKVRKHWRGRHGERWRRNHWRHHHRYYHDHFNPGAYIALGVIGALIDRGLSESVAQSAMERCAQQYRSFEWDTGLYTTYGGEKRLCPYLG